VQPLPNLRLAVCYSGAVKARLPDIAVLKAASTAVLTAALLALPVCAALAHGQSTPAPRATTAGSTSPTSGAGTSAAEPGEANPSSTDCEGGPCPAQTPTPHITIATPAPAPAAWSLQDRIKWATVVLLVLVAYIGIWFAVSTLQKIERQTHYAESAAQAAADTAKAALDFAQAHARTERPWILVSAEPAPGAPDAFTIVASNRGRGPARMISLTEGLAFAKDEVSLPPKPELKEPEPKPQLASMILLPGESVSIKAFRRDDVTHVCKTPEQLHRVENWEEKIYLFGKVTYVDLQTPDEKLAFETAWCCWYIHGRQRSGLVMAGKPPYNQHG
jgi:hypothetical protein